MKIAVEGCCHGELETIYAAMEKIEKKEGIKSGASYRNYREGAI